MFVMWLRSGRRPNVESVLIHTMTRPPGALASYAGDASDISEARPRAGKFGAHAGYRVRVLGKTAYRLRVRRVVKSRSFQQTAARVALGLKNSCQEVIRKRGAATGR